MFRIQLALLLLVSWGRDWQLEEEMGTRAGTYILSPTVASDISATWGIIKELQTISAVACLQLQLSLIKLLSANMDEPRRTWRRVLTDRKYHSHENSHIKDVLRLRLSNYLCRPPKTWPWIKGWKPNVNSQKLFFFPSPSKSKSSLRVLCIWNVHHLSLVSGT